MQFARMDDMIGGWFVGDFAPTALHATAFEVGIKHYSAGAYDPLHMHKIATEVTVILSGRAVMAGREVGPGDIITIEPGEYSDFRALEDVSLAVVKTPSAPADKYLASDDTETGTA